MALSWPSSSCDSGPAVFPEYFRMSSWETLPLTFDATNLLGDGQSIYGATAMLIQLSSGTDFAAGRYGPVQVDGALLTQIVTALAPHQRYRLVMQFSTDANTVWAPYLIVDCVA